MCSSDLSRIYNHLSLGMPESSPYSSTNMRLSPSYSILPIHMTSIVLVHLFWFPMLVCFHDLFFYKILLHRKWVRFKSVSYLLLDALLLCFNSYTCESIIKIIMPILMAIKKELLGDNPLYFCFQFIFILLSLGSYYYCNNLSLSCYFRFCAKSSL